MSLFPFRLRGNPSVEIANISRCLLVRINSVNLFANSAEYREWRNLGSDEDLRILRHHDCVRHKQGRLDGIAQPIVAGIADNANNLKPTVAPGDGQVKGRLALQRGHTDLAANGFAIRKELTGQSLID